MRGLGEKFGTNPVDRHGLADDPDRDQPRPFRLRPAAVAVLRLRLGQRPLRLRLEPGARRASPARPTRDCRAISIATSPTSSCSPAAEDLVPVLIQQGDAGSPTRPLAQSAARIPDPPLPAAHRGRLRADRALDEPVGRGDVFWRTISPAQCHDVVRPHPQQPHRRPRSAGARVRVARSARATTIGATPPATSTRKKTATASTSRPRTSGIGRRPAAVSTGIRSASATATAVRIFPTVTRLAPLPAEWLFEVVFDYGEHDATPDASDAETSTWPARPDPFSTYRAGFEVRTYRLCHRVLMFHHFQDELDAGRTCWFGRTDFSYAPDGDLADRGCERCSRRCARSSTPAT